MIENILRMFAKQPEPEKLDHGLFVQYSKRDPETNLIYEKVLKHEYQLPAEYQNWKRMKYRSLDVKRLTTRLKGQNFIDPEFPHTNSSISQEDSQIIFQWKRIPDIVKFCLYSSAETYQSFERISMSNKKLKQALVFMYRTHPTKFKQLLARDCNQQGIYEFKLYNKGVIQNVIIDDYVPVVNGVHPLMVGPIAQREIFPMLIEKAIAKNCGGYDKIPENLDEILQILFCGPLRKTKIDELTDTQMVARTVQNTILNNGVAAFISKNQPKIRNFGISENQIYHIIHKVSVNMKNQQQVQLYELISEKKLASWNGKFSHNDAEWQKVNHEQRTQLFKHLNKNKSFFVCASDISRIFDHMIAFDGTDITNKQWLQMQSQVLYPSFCTFQISQNDQVFIRITTKDPIRTSLIIAKDDGDQVYTYIDGKFHQNCYSLELSVTLRPGKYIICTHNDWILTRQGPYSIFMSNFTHSILKPGKQAQFPSFLQKMFKTLSERSKKIVPTPSFLTIKKCYLIGMLAKQTGFAFIEFSLKNTNQKQLFIDIDPKVLAHESWEIIQPNTGRKSIQLGKPNQDELILILKTNKYVSQQNVHFPSTAFKIKV